MAWGRRDSGHDTASANSGNDSGQQHEHDFVTHWWCEAHGRFSGDMAVGHAAVCSKRQWSETRCESGCGYSI
jgi:hypothetical protein